MLEIDYEETNEDKKIELTKNLILHYNTSKKDITVFDKSEEEEIVLDDHDDNVLQVMKLNNKSFISVSKDNTIKIWTFQGKLISSIDEHSDSILGVDIKENGICSVSKNNKIILSDLMGKTLYIIDEEVESLNNIKFWSDSIHILKGNKLSIYDNESGKEIISFDNHDSFIDEFHRLKNNNILTKSDGKVTLWTSTGENICDISISFSFSQMLELENHTFAILSSEKVYILDEVGQVVSSNAQSNIVVEFKKLLESFNQLIKYKNEKKEINQFPHIFNPFAKMMSNTIDEIKNQELDFSSNKHDKKVWDFFNRPLFAPIKKLLKKEENRTKRYLKNIFSDIEKNQKEKLDTELLIEKENKSIKLVTIVMVISLVVAVGVGYFVNKFGYGIASLSVLFIFMIFTKKGMIAEYNTLLEKLKSELETLNVLIDTSNNFILNLRLYRSSIINQIPIVNDASLFNGKYVKEYITNLLDNNINEVAMNECGLIESDIEHVDKKAIILNDWSLIQSNVSKVNKHNMHSFWGTQNGIIFSTQFIQYIFLTKDKIDVFNTHYDFIQNKFIRKEAHAFYYKDVTNITKKEVDRQLIGEDDITPATEITLKVSSGDSIELTILNDDTLTKLNASTKVENENDEKIDKLQDDKKEIENDDSLSEEEKMEEIKFIDAQINDLTSKEYIESSKIDESNKVDTTIQNIRAQIKAHKQ